MNDRQFNTASLQTSLLLAVFSAALFLLWPKFDLAASAPFVMEDKGFYLAGNDWVLFVRHLFIALYSIWYAAIIIMGADSGIRKVNHLSLNADQWLYLLLTSIIGPLVLTNLILKNNWGRARPRSIEEFGGTLEFSPALLISDQCETNCSFVSGEPSSMFMLFIPFAFLLPKHRWKFVGAAIVAGSVSGFIRIIMGGHFISDVIFAFIFMTLVAALVYRVMFLRKNVSKS